MAQQTGATRTPTVEQYLCTFAKKCGDADVVPETRDAPATKGFRLARSNAAGRAEPASATSRPSANPSYRATSNGVRGSRGTASRAMAAPTRSYASGGPRADLMIGFELNSARLTRDGSQAANVFAQSLMRPELMGKRFRIEGHTDMSGGNRINVPLSARRAQAVTDYLVSLGVDRSRIESSGFGASRPLAGRSSSDPANRRVEAELIS